MRKFETTCLRNGNWINGITITMVVVSVIGGAAYQAHAETVPIVAFEYPPFLSASLPNNGLVGEIVTEAFHIVGYDVSYQYYPFKRATQYVIDGDALATGGGAQQFPDDAQHNIQNIPIFYCRIPAFYLKARFQTLSFPTLKDLRGYHIGSLLGTGDTMILRRDPELHVEEVATVEQLFKKVEAGRSDFATLIDLSILSYLVANYPNWQERWGISEDIILGTPVGLTFSKKYPGYEKYLNAYTEGFQRIRENGTYRRIMETYYGRELVDKASEIAKPPYIIPIE